jgi:hypothetical protein
MTTNTVAQFWQARRAATIAWEQGDISVVTGTPLLLQLSDTITDVTLDGASIPVLRKAVNDTHVTLVCIPQGSHTLKVQ